MKAPLLCFTCMHSCFLTAASFVPHEEKIFQLNEKMDKLQVNLTSKGPAGFSINSFNSAEAKVVTKSEKRLCICSLIFFRHYNRSISAEKNREDFMIVKRVCKPFTCSCEEHGKVRADLIVK